jgi:hypothetical protein
MRPILLSLLMLAPCLAQEGANCKEAAGTVSTNFLDQTTTLGTATGDLRGGLGVSVLSVSTSGTNTVFHNHHHWVTEAGDTVFFADADATAYPALSLPGLFLVSYNNGVKVTGGTGRFAGASGTLAVFGAINLPQGQVVLRYSGSVCFRPVARGD